MGKLVADRLGWTYRDADDFHSPANVEKMRTGQPLTEEDRAPWLLALRALVQQTLAAGDDLVLACSALKASHRELLRVSSEVKFVYLEADEKTLALRLKKRAHHFMNPMLLRSQLETAEEPAAEEALVLETDRAPEIIADEIIAQLALPSEE